MKVSMCLSSANLSSSDCPSNTTSFLVTAQAATGDRCSRVLWVKEQPGDKALPPISGAFGDNSIVRQRELNLVDFASAESCFPKLDVFR